MAFGRRDTLGAEDNPMGSILFPLFVAILGVLMYALCVNPKLQEIGRILFFVGALVLTMVAAPVMVKLLGQ